MARRPVTTLIALYGIENGGVRQISSFLKSRGYDCNIIFFKRWVNNRISRPTEREVKSLLDLLTSIGSDIVGLSFGSPYLKIAIDISRRIKEVSGLPVIWGGIHPTLDADRCIEFADFVCVGEGEFPMLELVQTLERGESPRQIQNLYIRMDGKVFKNPVRPLITDIDSLPFRDFGGIDKYFIEDGRVIRGDPMLTSREFRVHASRGCPFKCAYCYNSSLRSIYPKKGNFHRIRSVHNVLEELKWAKTVLKKIRRVKFDDDTFIFPTKWLDEFCERYPKEVGIPFEILLNPKVAREGTLVKLKRAGLSRIQMGIQTGSEREAKEVFDRTSTNEDVFRFAEVNRRLGIDVIYDIIIDDPLAGKEDMEELMEFIKRLPRPYKLYLYSLTLYPKSMVAQRMIEAGLAEETDIEGDNTKSFYQFRVSLDYPREKEQVFYLALLVLVTKRFIPIFLIDKFHRWNFLRENPYLLLKFASFCNLIKMAGIGLDMLLKGEMSLMKFKEYASIKKMLTQ